MRRGWVLLGALVVVVAALAVVTAVAAPRKLLRVCADPNNLPFSNDRQEGFENKLADLVAADLGAEVRYTWWAQRRGFIRNTLNASLCDVVMGVPKGFELARTTRPYYRSGYVFVARQDSGPAVASLDDPRLRTARIGVHIIGDDYASIPPAHALASRGIVRNVIGYSIYGNYAEANPPARLVDAVSRGEIDLAVVWGPLAGYAVRHSTTPLAMTAIAPDSAHPDLPFAYGISMGVRRSDVKLLRALDGVIERRAREISEILDRYGVPREASETPNSELRIPNSEPRHFERRPSR